ncbi:MAG TPA: preprotein translocase subunit YajC [Tissierellia bacterium]|nr:preprotein translocase subunit YajC [Tissierellia bacterium]
MANASAGGAVNYTGLLVPIAFLVIFYFLAIRPQKKREKQINEMRESLKAGDEVITIGGMHGKVLKVKDDVVTLELGADRIKVDFSKWAIGSVINKDKQEEKKDK